MCKQKWKKTNWRVDNKSIRFINHRQRYAPKHQDQYCFNFVSTCRMSVHVPWSILSVPRVTVLPVLTNLTMHCLWEATPFLSFRENNFLYFSLGLIHTEILHSGLIPEILCFIRIYVETNTSVYLSLPPTRQDLTQGQKTEGRLKWGWKGGEGRERAETRTLLVYAAHRLTWCNVSLVRQAVSRTQMWVRARMPGYGLN